MSTATMMVMEPSPSVHDPLTGEKTHVVESVCNVTSSSPSTCASLTTTSITTSTVMNESSTSIATTSLSEPIAIEQGTKPLFNVAPYIVRPLEDDTRALQLAQRRLEIQLAFVDRAQAKIKDQSHPDFQQRLQSITKERDGLLQQASQQLTYWETCTSILYAYECAEARREYDVNCEKLRQEMLEEIQLEIDSIYEQRQGNHNSHNRKTTRKTRTRRQKILSQDNASDEEGMNGELETKELKKKRVGNVFPLLEKRLAHSEVEHDLRELTGTIESMKKKRRVVQEHVPYVTKYYRSTLFYQDVLFREGDVVFIQSTTSTTSTTMNTSLSNEYIAIIISITSTELFVLSEIGTYHRLVFMDLRQGRTRISALTPEQTAALNERALNG